MEEQIVEQVEQTLVEQPVQEAAPTNENVAHNLAMMRKKLEAEAEARKQAERRAEEAERLAAARNTMQSVSPESEEEFALGDPDDYAQNKNIQKVTKKLSSKFSQADHRVQKLEEKLAYLEAKAEMGNIKDFDQVVTDENLKTFQTLYPRDFATMMKNPDLTEKSVTLYNMIKNYGILNNKIKDSQEKIQANKQKPAVGAQGNGQTPQTPLARLNDYDRRVLTEADRDRILARVEEMRRRG